MTAQVRLYGAGGHAQVIADTLAAAGRSVIVHYDDRSLGHHPATRIVEPGVRGRVADFPHQGPPLIIAVGENRERAALADLLDVRFTSAIHPSAVVSPSARVGEGTVVFAGAVVQANTTLGRHVIVNTSASVDHDNVIGDYAHISPQVALCGHVEVGEGTHVGAGATVIPGIRIGRWCRVGAGAVVIRDVPDHTTVVGNPARVIKQHRPTGSTASTHADLTFVGSGIATSLTLLRLADRLERAGRQERPMRVAVIEKSGEFHTGIAYGLRSGISTLLVTSVAEFLPASEHEAFYRWMDDEHVEIFAALAETGGTEVAAWLTEHRVAIAEKRWGELYLPRNTFGLYLARAVSERVEKLSADGLLEVDWIHDEVMAVERTEVGLRLTLSSQLRSTDRLVLAVGSPSVRRFWPAELETSPGACLVQDLYDPGLGHHLTRIAAQLRRHAEPAEVLIVGANASALEVLFQLSDRPELRSLLGRVTVLSRTGELPRCAREPDETSSTGPHAPYAARSRLPRLEKLIGRTGLRAAEVADAALADIERARHEGTGAANALASIGAEFGAMLDSLDESDKVAFATVHGPEISRHQRRGGPHYAPMLAQLGVEGRLRVTRGVFLGLSEEPAGAEDSAAGVRYRYRDPDTDEVRTRGPVAVVVNCAGYAAVDAPETTPLLAQLTASGLCRPTASGAGLVVDDRLETGLGVHVVGPLLAGNVINGRPVWHTEHCGRIAGYAEHLADVLAAEFAAGGVTARPRPSEPSDRRPPHPARA